MNKMLGSIIATAALALSVSAAQAEHRGEVHGAQVLDVLDISPFGCTVLDGNGSLALATSGKIVMTNNKKGNSMIKCSVKGVAAPDGDNAVTWDANNMGLLCTIGNSGTTSKWNNVVTPSGKSILTCHINGSSD